LPPVGRPRAEDHADLALLDDRVGLGAEPGVHEQLVDIAQAAHFPVDQVLTVARAKQAARHLDVAREDAGKILERLDAERRADQQRHRRGGVGLGPSSP
jgi:hypothetical protein